MTVSLHKNPAYYNSFYLILKNNSVKSGLFFPLGILALYVIFV